MNMKPAELINKKLGGTWQAIEADSLINFISAVDFINRNSWVKSEISLTQSFSAAFWKTSKST